MAHHRHSRKAIARTSSLNREAQSYFPGCTPNQFQILPFALKEANQFVLAFHRHNGSTAWNGGKFAIALRYGSSLVGVAIVGNPLSATFMDRLTAEVLRNCTSPQAPLGSVSKLYAACWRIWRQMGGTRLITYTLQSESGASLRGAGWRLVAETTPTRKNWNKTERRAWQPVYGQPKFRWEISV